MRGKAGKQGKTNNDVLDERPSIEPKTDDDSDTMKPGRRSLGMIDPNTLTILSGNRRSGAQRARREPAKPAAAGKPEYRPFTPEAAAQFVKQFKIAEREAKLFKIDPNERAAMYTDELFKLVTRTTDNYEHYRKRQRLADYHQRKDALRALARKLRGLESFIARKSTVLEFVIDDPLLRLLGELLTYEALEWLLGKHVRRGPCAGATGDTHDEQTRLDRSLIAVEAGPPLLDALIGQMHSAAQTSLARMPSDKGGKPTPHVLRQVMIAELAQHYEWFFGKPPTTTVTGKFGRFCYAILQEMCIDLTGIKGAIERSPALKSR
jgi:hypothetical protein